MRSKLKTAIYHPEQGREVALDVMGENKDGSLDLGIQGEDGNLILVVSNVNLSDSPIVGGCTQLTK
jgi:hypothetical protein